MCFLELLDVQKLCCRGIGPAKVFAQTFGLLTQDRYAQKVLEALVLVVSCQS